MVPSEKSLRDFQETVSGMVLRKQALPKAERSRGDFQAKTPILAESER